jgi:hypothetical protein
LNNNLVYVPDIATGSVARWILTSGLTIEEAAVIQPSYNYYPTEPPAIPADAIDLTNSNWSGIVGDLRFSNFKLIATSNTEVPAVNIPVTNTFCVIMWCSVVSHIETFHGQVQELQLSLNQPTVSAGAPADVLDPQSILQFPPELDNLTRAVIQFDVETVSPSQRIAILPNAYSLKTWPGQPITYSRNEVALFVTGSRDQLLLDHGPDDLEATPFTTPIGIGTVILPDVVQPFEPVSKMTIVTDMWFMNGQSHQAQMLHFDLITIPEPGAQSIIALASLAGLTQLRLRCRAT